MPAHFIDLEECDFPFTIECYDAADNSLMWRQEVSGPGAMEVRGAGKPVSIKVEWPDGQVVWSHPTPGKEGE